MHFLDRTYGVTIESGAISAVLDTAEQAVVDGRSLAGTGFWKAVSAVKREPILIEEHADRIAAIDQAAFSNWALLTIPVPVGTGLMLLASAVGLLLLSASYWLESPFDILSFGAGLVVLLVTTHGLAHLVVGAVVGIGFTAWFIGTLARPQPGVKVDYSTYLRTEPMRRAWMHASGAITTKLVPLLLIGVVVFAELPGWIILALVGLTLVTAVTDVVWSTKSSDWKKFVREREFAQTS